MTAIEKQIMENGGFITSQAEEDALIAENPHRVVLVRCGNGRFKCPIQNLPHFVRIINKEGSDYVRDVSINAQI
jgi:hypothetical protein